MAVIISEINATDDKSITARLVPDELGRFRH